MQVSQGFVDRSGFFFRFLHVPEHVPGKKTNKQNTQKKNKGRSSASIHLR
jgi:hypothetical protein